METKNVTPTDLRKNEKQKMGLIFKILGASLVPLILVVLFAVFSMKSLAGDVAERLEMHELHATGYSLLENFNNVDEGDFSLKDGKLYKGDTCISEKEDFFDEFSKEADIAATLVVGKTRMITSVKDSSGKRAVGTEISDDAYNKVIKDGSYFVTGFDIQGEAYDVYYELEDDSVAGEEIIIFTGIKSSVAKNIYENQLISVVIELITVALIGIVLITVIGISIVRAISVAVGNLDKIADGELNFEVSKKLVNRHDEVGNIARSVHTLIMNLANIVTSIINSSKTLDSFTGIFQSNFTTINNSISNVNTAIEEIANGASNQANEAQTVSIQMNDMGNAIDTTTNNLITLQESTETMKTQNGNVNTTLEDLIEISNRTKASIDEVQKQTAATNKSAAEISAAVDLITGIASQTNLLSLNASIEAARAGEHGKGFAVVADEIRQLADQSSESAEKISQVVKELIHNSNINVETMQKVLGDVNDQFDKLNATREVFDKLNAEVNNVAVAIGTISNEIDLINNTKDEVIGSVENLASIAQENAASTEETSAAMIELGDIVNECNESTNQLVAISAEMSENAGKFELGSR